MDTDKILHHSAARFEHAAAKRTLKEKYQAKMIFGHRGGMFRATPDTMVFLNLYGDQDTVLLDLYENPILVNAKELCDLMKSRWQEQMNAWLVEYTDINNKR